LSAEGARIEAPRRGSLGRGCPLPGLERGLLTTTQNATYNSKLK